MSDGPLFGGVSEVELDRVEDTCHSLQPCTEKEGGLSQLAGKEGRISHYKLCSYKPSRLHNSSCTTTGHFLFKPLEVDKWSRPLAVDKGSPVDYTITAARPLAILSKPLEVDERSRPLTVDKGSTLPEFL